MSQFSNLFLFFFFFKNTAKGIPSQQRKFIASAFSLGGGSGDAPDRSSILLSPYLNHSHNNKNNNQNNNQQHVNSASNPSSPISANSFTNLKAAATSHNQHISPLIVPHVARETGERYTLESLFRSANQVLLDSVCSELAFDVQFFPIGADQLEQIQIHLTQTRTPVVSSNLAYSFFASRLFSEQTVIQTYLAFCQHLISNSFDTIGVFLVYQLNKQHSFLMQTRQMSVLDDYLGKIEKMCWNQFTVLFLAQLESIKQAIVKITKDTTLSNGVRPHLVTKNILQIHFSLFIIFISLFSLFSVYKTLC